MMGNFVASCGFRKAPQVCLTSFFVVSLLGSSVVGAQTLSPQQSSRDVRIVGEGAIGVVSGPVLGKPVEKNELPDIGENPQARDLETQVSVGGELEPYKMLRSLQLLQGQAAQGSTHALSAQRDLLREMDRRFMLFPDEVWAEPRNARAAVLHVLSGGNPQVVWRLLQMSERPAIDEGLLKGALAYAQGKKRLARELFEQFDPLALPPALGAQVALARATLIAADDPKESLKYLSQARLLMPGSLVEEAALRRAVFIAGGLDDFENFQSLSIQYLRRYRNSVFADDFRRRFAFVIRRFGLLETVEAFPLLETLLSEFDIDSRRGLYLILARNALVHGNINTAKLSARAALPLSVEDTADYSRAHLYISGSMLDADEVLDGVEHLWAVDRDMLDDQDRQLAEAVSAILNDIRYWPESPHIAYDFADVRPEISPDDPSWGLLEIARGRAELRRSDELIAQATQRQVVGGD